MMIASRRLLYTRGYELHMEITWGYFHFHPRNEEDEEEDSPEQQNSLI